MTSTPMNMTRNLTLGRVEKSGIVVTGILVLLTLILGSQALAIGVAVGGLLVIANFLAIRLLVGALIGKAYTKGYSIFILLVKMLVLVALVVIFFLFTKLNIYGFFIGVSGVVLVIIGESLRGNKDGAL
ncbi:MAG: ATP synthase subunit I [Thermodesulfobacteriota bacterium]